MEYKVIYSVAWAATLMSLGKTNQLLSDQEIFEVCDAAIESAYRGEDFLPTTINSCKVFIESESECIDFLEYLLENILGEVDKLENIIEESRTEEKSNRHLYNENELTTFRMHEAYYRLRKNRTK